MQAAKPSEEGPGVVCARPKDACYRRDARTGAYVFFMVTPDFWTSKIPKPLLAPLLLFTGAKLLKF